MNTQLNLDLPTRLNSVLAAVAADLLENRRPSGKTCWLEHGSSRLSHHIWELTHRYDWPMKSDDVKVPTSDGRNATISEYYLSPEVIDAQGERGSQFIEAVRKARLAQRCAKP